MILFEIYNQQIMILPYNKTNKSGEKVKYWTHSSFVENEKFEKIIAENQTRMKYRNYLGLFGFIVGLKLSSIPAIAKVVPPKIPAPGFAALLGLASFAIGHLALVGSHLESNLDNLLDSSTLPLWKSKSNVISLDRAFFHLDETRNNQPNLLYHGLTSENAARIFPDLISGPLPKAPEKHGHGHGHHGHQHTSDHGSHH